MRSSKLWRAARVATGVGLLICWGGLANSNAQILGDEGEGIGLQGEGLGGISTRERRDVMRTMRMLRSGDEDIRRAGGERLNGLAQEIDLVRYLEALIPNTYNPRQIQETFQLMWSHDSRRATALALKLVTTPPAVHRAEALRILAKSGSPKYAEYLTRGLVDVDFDVSLAAVRGLRTVKSPESTPILIAKFDSFVRGYRTTWSQALCNAWNVPADTEGSNTLEFWESHWEKNARTVRRAYSPKSLKPLSKENLNIEDLISL